MKYICFSRIFALAVTLSCSCLWYLFDCPEAEYSSKYSLLIFIYAGSAFLEVFVEPAVIYTLKTGDNALFSYSQSILTVLQKIIVFGFVVITNVDHVYAFCIAQVSFWFFIFQLNNEFPVYGFTHFCWNIFNQVEACRSGRR